MKRLGDYIAEVAQGDEPLIGDNVAIELSENSLIQSHVIELTEDGIVLQADEEFVQILESHGCALEAIATYGAAGHSAGYGHSLPEGKMGEMEAMYQDWKRLPPTAFYNIYKITKQQFVEKYGELVKNLSEYALDEIVNRAGLSQKFDETAPYQPEQDADHNDPLLAKSIDDAAVGAMEAKYQGREVSLGKPMPGDVKKSKVYVRDPATGNIKKVNFGHGGTSAKRAGQKPMHIKKDNPERRKNFRARHNCDNPGPRTKARYWSCRAW